VPTLGDWGFWLARVGDRPTAAEIEGARSFLSGVTLTELTHLPRDFAPPAPGEPSLLFDQRLTATFRQERGLD
jgi:predicted membrane-bound spermidine synthase